MSEQQPDLLDALDERCFLPKTRATQCPVALDVEVTTQPGHELVTPRLHVRHDRSNGSCTVYGYSLQAPAK